MSCCYFTVFQYIFGLSGIYALFKLVTNALENKKWARWSKTPKDVVILHCFPRFTTIPNGSPFVLKLQTYLRMANIQHKIETKDFKGPKGKSPWITLNGQHMGDSQLIVNFLNKKFDKNLDNKFSKEQLAIAASIRIMLEEHAFWGLAMERFVFGNSFGKIMKRVPFIMNLILKTVVKFNIKRQTFHHGIGRHSETDIVDMVTNDFRIVSTILGSKKYIIGDDPCVDDCAIFGMVAQLLWGLPDSPYEKLVNSKSITVTCYSGTFCQTAECLLQIDFQVIQRLYALHYALYKLKVDQRKIVDRLEKCRCELTNLREYCLRMKERFFPDWDQCLRR